MADETELDLEPGDFLYQADSELFLVVMEETENSYRMAAHGWRNIGKQRLDEYVNGKNGKLFTQDHVDQIVEEEADADAKEIYDELTTMFEMYDGEFEDDGPHTEFPLEDT